MKKKLWLAALCSCALWTGAVSADPLDISDIFTLYSPDNTISFQVIVTEADEVAFGPQHLYAIKVPFNKTLFGLPIILTEPGAPPIIPKPGGPVFTQGSDFFGIATFPDGSVALAFSSDDDSGAPFFPTDGTTLGTVLVETGLPVDVTKYLDPVSLQAKGFTATFQSDVEATPIPAALPLFAAGLGALCLLSRRRKRKAQAVGA